LTPYHGDSISSSSQVEELRIVIFEESFEVLASKSLFRHFRRVTSV
jgi:hypothetical protein